jgi:hypothetical protein
MLRNAGMHWDGRVSSVERAAILRASSSPAHVAIGGGPMPTRQGTTLALTGPIQTARTRIHDASWPAWAPTPRFPSGKHSGIALRNARHEGGLDARPGLAVRDPMSDDRRSLPLE